MERIRWWMRRDPLRVGLDESPSRSVIRFQAGLGSLGLRFL